MRLLVKPLAEQDLEAIGDYIARDDPKRAITFVRELRAHCTHIASNPRDYRERPEEVLPDVVEIVRILHGARDLSAILGKG